eukprot:CAMPEP_0196663894 /NCGR_PEP_ID=MMETSP1086-20130531/54673_1 /TAXON_ID=77921 /ORGANISM="Cyanoptyche  gloeocystis , Strain SAG4.97" /LENGTH=110 /DNA_ID=CAMNT_0041999895 /DNA_START=6 /DNA_END=338 /DNA_ORIENTATION=+
MSNWGRPNGAWFDTQKTEFLREVYRKEANAQETYFDLSDDDEQEEVAKQKVVKDVPQNPPPPDLYRGMKSTYRLHYTGPNRVGDLDRTKFMLRDEITEFRELKQKVIKFR